MNFKTGLLILLFTALPAAWSSPADNGLRDPEGRHVIPRGFVIVTSYRNTDLDFGAEDYLRMVRLGANSQVIRLELGKLSRFEGATVDPSYLVRLDALVEHAKQAGITTVFKMTTYGVKFSWEGFWANENKEHSTYIDAWKLIWERYQNEPYVIGYDLVNEPRKLTMDISYDDLVKEHLIPLYQRIIDEHNQISPDKLYLLQSIFQNKGHKTDGIQYTEIKYPVNRDNVVFAPHIYQKNMEFITPELERFQNEGSVLKAPIFIGEWGYPTFRYGTDDSVFGEIGQLEYMKFYIHTAQEMDRLGMGAIKAWFLGSKSYGNFLPHGESTWAIFTDDELIGDTERKYITDIIARPYPQAIAGDIESFFFDFATRTLTAKITTDNSLGSSRIFVGANRHYPDGFTLSIGDSLVLSQDPIHGDRLKVNKSHPYASAAAIIWDPIRQQIIIESWPVDKQSIEIKLSPGTP
ncbi:cellulase family glycosylhydrolase [Pelagicoccus enzymogenes]|uniref:cellulase family glycosylhydrolase n=1 Tax=Pelagicoccus enzymogenes TaxID=2773457 RepID=UPI00280FC4D8|nr:cellulase family glycosylhydrolase [Pelagicoccus enzymogenes]MDQ8198649.1 cellulase family glycosylhydrolase [Pelagicoccus enzymogenes]